MPAIPHRTNHLHPGLELIVYILDDSIQQATLDPGTAWNRLRHEMEG